MEDRNIIATLANLNTKNQQENAALQAKLVAALEKLAAIGAAIEGGGRKKQRYYC